MENYGNMLGWKCLRTSLLGFGWLGPLQGYWRQRPTKGSWHVESWNNFSSFSPSKAKRAVLVFLFFWWGCHRYNQENLRWTSMHLRPSRWTWTTLKLPTIKLLQRSMVKWWTWNLAHLAVMERRPLKKTIEPYGNYSDQVISYKMF